MLRSVLATLIALPLALPASAQEQDFTSGVNISDADTASADLFVDGISVLDDPVCIGGSCTDEEVFASDVLLKLKGGLTHIEFDDRSTGPTGNDWKLLVNDSGGGTLNRFSIEDMTAGTIPFTIRAPAPDNAFYIDFGGNIGLGTNLPTTDLHIVDPVAAEITLETTFGDGSEWQLEGSESFFVVSDQASGTIPFALSIGTPTASIFAGTNGNIGLGTLYPEGKLHTRGSGVQLAYFESVDGGPVQVRFRTDSENRRFLATNNANEVKSQIIFKDNEILFTGQTDSGANKWLTIGPAGIVSQGPTCNPGPCDATFDPDAFTVPPIAERAAYMWENQHLFGVGPTKPDAPINLTEKMGGVIHELEVAHIYIEQLNDRLAQQQAMLDLQRSEIDAMKAMLAEK